MSYQVSELVGAELTRALQNFFDEGLNYRLEGRIEVTCREADGAVAWEAKKSNIITDYGRREFLSTGINSLAIVTSPSTETPVVGRYAHTDNGATNSGQVSSSIIPTVDGVTLTKTWATTFAVPPADRTVSLVGLGKWSATVGVYALVAYTLLPVPKVQKTTQTLEVQYKITVTPNS